MLQPRNTRRKNLACAYGRTTFCFASPTKLPNGSKTVLAGGLSYFANLHTVYKPPDMDWKQHSTYRTKLQVEFGLFETDDIESTTRTHTHHKP
jgi:hypothetical protein